MMGKCYVYVLVSLTLALQRNVLCQDIEYRDCIVATAKSSSSNAKMFPGTPVDYVGMQPNTSVLYRYAMIGTHDTSLLSIEIDYQRSQLYIFDANTVNIYRLDNFDWQQNFTGLSVSTVHEGVSASVYTRLALDWVTGNIYWTDPLYAWVAMQHGQSNSGFKILVHEDLEWPLAVAVDPRNKYLFWSDVGSTVKIERASLAGTDRTAIVLASLVRPLGISIDYWTDQIVWIDDGRDTVETADYNGMNRRVIRRLPKTQFLDVAVFKDYVLTTESTTSGILIINKNSGAFDTLKPGEDNYLTAKMYSADTQDTTIANQCDTAGCDHVCVNGDNGPVCLCHEGFQLNPDGMKCSEGFGLFHRAFVQSNKTHVCLNDIRRLTARHGDVFECIFTYGQDINHFDIDMASRKIIMADGDTIYSANIDGTITKNRILTAQSTITGLALDWTDNNIYWTDSSGVHLVSQSTSTHFTLIDQSVNNPNGLIVVPFRKAMLWISGTSGDFMIEKAKLDGSDRETIVTVNSSTSPSSLFFDTKTDTLYFYDGELKNCSLDGSNVQTMAGFVTYDDIYRVFVYKHYIVVAEHYDIGAVYDITSTFDHQLGKIIHQWFEYRLPQITDMKVLDESLQPPVPGPCDTLNGNCEQICVPTGTKRSCQCEFGYRLDSDKESCVSDPLTEEFVIVTDSTNNRMYQVSLDTNFITAIDSDTFGSPVGVLYDQNTKTVFWSTAYFIHSCKLDGSQFRVLVYTGGCAVDRMAIDYTDGNIFFTMIPNGAADYCAGVGVAKGDGKYKTLVSGGSRPRAIALDPGEGLMFWTDHASTPPYVNKANMDGSQVELVTNTDLVWPNGLAIDTKAKVLYLTDGGTNKILLCTYVGACTVFYEDAGAHLMDIKLIGDYLYYTAWNKYHITKLNKDNVTDQARLAEHAELGRLDSITFDSAASTKSESEACLPKHGLKPCSTFCLPTQSGYTCTCEEGVALRSDNRSCTNVIDCGNPGDIPNGTMTSTNGTYFPSVITYSCDKGFSLLGHKTRTCQANGEWSGCNPRCQSNKAVLDLISSSFKIAFPGSNG